MTFEVEVGGRPRVVVVERTGQAGQFRVTVDGAPHLLDVARTGPFGLSILSGAGGAAENVAAPLEIQFVPSATSGEWLATFDGRLVTVGLNGRRRHGPEDAGAHAHGDCAIAAPMPGRVVRVLVGVGDTVTAGQGVVVVEAMKMENELRAPRAGRVKEVGVTAGAPVEAGRILAVIE
jgi:biotin carboxyl carrier protein